MKSLILSIALLLCGVELTFGQSPVQPPKMGAIGYGILAKKTGADSLYTPKEVELFALSAGVGPRNWCDTLVKKVKQPLAVLGYEVDSMDRSWTLWILEHSKDTLVYVSGGYVNSKWGSLRVIDPFNVTFTGWLHVTMFVYENCRVILYKSTCANIVWIELPPAQVNPKPTPPAPPARKSPVILPPTQPLAGLSKISGGVKIVINSNSNNVTYNYYTPQQQMQPQVVYLQQQPQQQVVYVQQEPLFVQQRVVLVRPPSVIEAGFHLLQHDENYTEGNVWQKMASLPRPCSHCGG